MPKTSKSRVKLVDIASASGVSLAAVSLALSGKPGISQETRSRVMETARSLGYRFKTVVPAAPVKAMKTIGLLVKSSQEDDPHANQFYSQIISGIEAASRQMGMNLMFAHLPVNDENCPTEIPPLLERGELDGVILAGVLVTEDLVRVLEAHSRPVVLVDSYCFEQTYNSVLTDNFTGAYQAVEYLLGKGHRQIGFIGGHEQAYPSFLDRRRGYAQALADHHAGPPAFADSSRDRAAIREAALHLLDINPRITALMGVNDEAVVKAMTGLMEAGRRVPQDISVVGFDDIHLAESVLPALTTLRVHRQAMGRLAVQLLMNQSQQPDGGIITSIFRPILVERSSVGPVRLD